MDKRTSKIVIASNLQVGRRNMRTHPMPGDCARYEDLDLLVHSVDQDTKQVFYHVERNTTGMVIGQRWCWLSDWRKRMRSTSVKVHNRTFK